MLYTELRRYEAARGTICDDRRTVDLRVRGGDGMILRYAWCSIWAKYIEVVYLAHIPHLAAHCRPFIVVAHQVTIYRFTNSRILWVITQRRPKTLCYGSVLSLYIVSLFAPDECNMRVDTYKMRWWAQTHCAQFASSQLMACVFEWYLCECEWVCGFDGMCIYVLHDTNQTLCASRRRQQTHRHYMYMLCMRTRTMQWA